MWGTYKELKSVIEKFDINLENSDISGLIHTVVTPVLLGIPITGDALGFWTVRFFQKMEVWMPNLWNGAQ
ncbi:hypothetical protein Bca4012_025726 [Brassica carinata]